LDEAKGLLQVITDYAYALTTLDHFDHGTLWKYEKAVLSTKTFPVREKPVVHRFLEDRQESDLPGSSWS